MLETLRGIKRDGLPARVGQEGASPAFGQVTQRWLESLDLANSTMAGYRKIVRNHVLPYLGDTAVSVITYEQLNNLYSHLRQDGRKDSKAFGMALKANSVNKVHQVVRSILDYAEIQGEISQNVARSPRVAVPSARRMRSEKDEIEVWTMAQTRAVLEWNSMTYQDDLHTMWRLIAKTGIRRGEAVALRWKDFDFANEQFTVMRAADSAKAGSTKPTKTYRNRSLDLDATTVYYLQKHRQERAQFGPSYVVASAFVFGTVKNELRGPNDVTRRWTRMVRQCQAALAGKALPLVTIQGLRHGHATHLLQAGAQPKVVQERLGHSNIQTTMDIYSHLLPTIQRDALKLLEEKWGAEV
jgi:integrase